MIASLFRSNTNVCAQAMCLEEMLQLTIPSGALFYGTTRRRMDVVFDETLRCEVERLAERMHDLHKRRCTPIVEYAPKCDNCSLLEVCLPKQIKDASRYLLFNIRGTVEGQKQ
jgi:CRISPR-associated exonuclease Cas4